MNARIAINGFGRVGRSVLRILLEQPETSLDVVAINDLTSGDVLAQLYNYDSVYGRAAEPAHAEQTADGEELVIGRRRIRLSNEADPAKLPWATLEIGTVLESTGRFTKADAARAHLDAGAQRVLVSAPSKGADATLVKGVNWASYDRDQHRIVSMASCTTNALAPLARVLHDVAGIEQGIVSTVHAYTHDQNLVDGPHRDLRRARAAALNIVPTSTGAAKAIGLVLPELDGRLIGDALRVPVPVGSLVELTALVEREVTVDEVRAAYREAAADEQLAGVLEYTEAPLVSTDIVGAAASSIFDAGLARVLGRQVKVSAWYDNEWGFSHRVADTLELFGAE